MFTVIVTLDVQEGLVDEFRQLIVENATASLANEPGCVTFEVSESVELPGRFFFYEVYTDRDAFEIDHHGSAHYADFVARSTPLIVPNSKSIAKATLTPLDSETPQK